MKRKDSTDDRKRQGQHKRPNTKMDRQEQDKTKVSAQHQSFEHVSLISFYNTYNNFQISFEITYNDIFINRLHITIDYIEEWVT